MSAVQRSARGVHIHIPPFLFFSFFDFFEFWKMILKILLIVTYFDKVDSNPVNIKVQYPVM